MVSYDSLARALDEREIATRVAIPHDDARARYALTRTTVRTFQEFMDVATEYYTYHYTTCVGRGAQLSPLEARSETKSLLESQLRRGEGDIATYFVRARDGLDGGMKGVVDAVADGLKTRAIANYVRDVFDLHVAPHEWEDKVEIIRQFIKTAGPYLHVAIDHAHVERYARDYRELIQDYVRALRSTSAMFRRL